MAMDTAALHMRRIGDRAVVAPAYQLESIREALQERGTYPKVTGQIVPPDILEETEDEDDETDEDEDEQDTSDEEESS